MPAELKAALCWLMPKGAKAKTGHAHWLITIVRSQTDTLWNPQARVHNLGILGHKWLEQRVEVYKKIFHVMPPFLNEFSDETSVFFLTK